MEIMRALSEHVHIHRTPQGTTVVLEFEVGTAARRSADGPEQRPRAAAATGD
jgi:hypothetical protein